MNIQKEMLAAMLLLIVSFARAQTVEYIHTDALGSPVAVTNASGAVIERTVYEPYGAVINRPVTNGPGYTGHVMDATTGLNYMQQRYYDPQLGRFLSNDPVTATSIGGNFNRYWYANNNPYRFVDRDGRQAGQMDCRSPFVKCYGGSQGGGSSGASGTSTGGSAALAGVHVALGTASMAMDATGIGATVSWIPDLIDAAVSVAEGDLKGAGLSVAGAVPIVGNVANGIKLGRVGANTVDAAKGGLVIGRGADLAMPGALRAGEYVLKWDSKLPNFKAEWAENAGRLREVMRQGNPIRDASVGNTGGIFLNAERALLKDRGWTFHSPSGYWMPPGP